MSNIYLLEPHTNGKVILHTSYGDISVELWSKEAPKACRNFIQLCMEGYYNDTIFHRIVAGFIIQGGDPEGTGLGGESCFDGGKPFQDEFHSRLRFVRRGLVAMANSGVPNDNRSQFFITLDATPELQNKHTIFGKVEGDTIFNVLKIGGLEVDKDERPLYPPKVTSCTIIVNPFDDIVPRISRQELEATRLRELEAQKKPEKQKKLKKNVALLSFADEASDLIADEQGTKKKILSSHDLLEDDPTLSREVGTSLVSEDRASSESKDRKKRESNSDKDESERNDSDRKRREQEGEDDQESANAFDQLAPLSEAERRRQEIQKLESDIRKMHNRDGDIEADAKKKDKLSKVSLLQLERNQYKTRGEAKGGKRLKSSKSGSNSDKQRELLEKLSAFEAKVFSGAREPEPNPAPKRNDAPPCKIHGIPSCESCYDATPKKKTKITEDADDNEEGAASEDDSDNDFGWMQHKLVFEKDLKGKEVSLSAKRDDVNDYIVIDPLNKASATTAARRSGYDRDERTGRDSRGGRDNHDSRDSRDGRDNRDSRERYRR
ncbi:cyclophilin-like domain-containing protein [Gamsiella multidivaricata]|uniref:cyclophilin-like domain-containing protein n=1 Tax=Gamsiella multidivaricata TaxID=101098 RepID=UPI00221E8E90|nr:cyclophilin-like domain-containing protein [Gamsiella multidivaricata]KAI7819268.1 cyclophilin-like domain-containing protein [Gamsiella multidivaricata]